MPKITPHVKRVLEMPEAGDLPTVDTAHRVLEALQEQGLAAKSVKTYYNAWRHYCGTMGVATHDWPKAPNPPRKVRPMLTRNQALNVIKMVESGERLQGKHKADALRLGLHAGLRLFKEAVRPDGWIWLEHNDDAGYSIMLVSGKGGHEREVIVLDPETRAIEGPPPINGKTAARAFETAVAKVTDNPYVRRGNLPTPHSLRHIYAGHLYDGNKDIIATRNQLGHTNVATTEHYLEHTRRDDLAAKLVDDARRAAS